MPSFLIICEECGFHIHGEPNKINSSHVCNSGLEKNEGFGGCLGLIIAAMTGSKNQSVTTVPPTPPPPPPPFPAPVPALASAPIGHGYCFMAELKQVLK